MLLFEIVLGSPPEQIVCALPIDPADGAEQDEQVKFDVVTCTFLLLVFTLRYNVAAVVDDCCCAPDPHA